ncbi:MAG: hypothetical protein KKA79_00890 [Nanoarchaeota archaeon]|nr:hypothetical protein [Nanoarchaeota archaeon]MCG2717710.1 hypothetical protein [Nanoarchaeota archaeon]
MRLTVCSTEDLGGCKTCNDNPTFTANKITKTGNNKKFRFFRCPFLIMQMDSRGGKTI